MTALLVALLVVLADAADSTPIRIGFVGLHGGAFEVFQSLADDAGVEVGYVPDDQIAAGDADFGRFRIVLLQHLREENGRELEAAIRTAQSQDPPTRFFALSQSGTRVTDANGQSLVTVDAALASSYRQPRRENLDKLLRRAAGLAVGVDRDLGEPLPLAIGAIHHPSRSEPFEDSASLRAYLRDRGVDVDRSPRVAIVCHSTHYLLQQPEVAAALVSALERRGAMAFVAIDSLREDYQRLMLELAPEAAIHTCHSGEDIEFREELGAPHLTSAFFRKQSIDEWRASPQGLAPDEVVFHCVTQELIGGIEPFATCGTVHGGGSAEAFTPIPDRVDRLVERTLNHVRLRRTANADKRVAMVYYDREASRSSLFRGSPTGMFLNAPASVIAVLQAMKDQGYQVHVPADEDELIGLAQKTGRVIGINDAGEAQRLADEGEVPVVPLSLYQRWYEDRVPAAVRAVLEERWGPPPGRINVVQVAGEPAIVIPRVDLGNVVLVPQPLRGEAYDPRQTHDKVTPIPHSYLAAYLWIEHGFEAHAMVHFGTHGSEILLPGKSVGLAESDWSDVVIGRVPNLQPWVMNNTGESILARRRSYAVLIDHLVPPTADAGRSDGLARLHQEVDRFSQMQEGVLRETLRRNLRLRVEEENLAADLQLETGPDAPPLTDAEIDRVNEYLHAIEDDITPVSLHRLGQPPADDARIPWLVHCVGQPFLDALDALPGVGPVDVHHGKGRLRDIARSLLMRHLRDGEEPLAALQAIGATVDVVPEELARGLEDAALIDGGLSHTSDEIDHLLAGLSGRFIPPGPGNSPDRNPRAVPTGRNMYLIDPREVPTPESWEVGKRLAEDLLASHREAGGEWPEKVAFDLRAMSTFRDFGVMEAQILWLLGCEPVRESNGQVLDVRVVPRETLGRPRVDVFIRAGNRYNDMLADRLKLLDVAARLATAQDEADNAVRRASEARRAKLVAEGEDPERAAILSAARIYGASLDGDNAAVSYLIERSGDWERPEDIGRAQLDNWRHVYTDGAWGEEARSAFLDAITGSDYVMRNWSDPTRGPTTNRYMWKHGGALALAIEQANGNPPRYFLADLRDLKRPRLVAAEDALRMDFRVRVFNRKWMTGLMKEGYAGADQFKVVVSNAYGWQVTRRGSVPNEFLEEIVDLYVRDRLDLGLREFFEEQNPWALQGICETLLEMARKELWDADPRSLAELAQVLQQSRDQHGAGGGLLTAGNDGLETYARAILAGVAAAESTADAADEPPADTEPAPSGLPVTTALEVAPEHVDESSQESPSEPLDDTVRVDGVAIAPKPSQTAPPSPPAPTPWKPLIAAAALALIGVGFVTHRRVAP